MTIYYIYYINPISSMLHVLGGKWGKILIILQIKLMPISLFPGPGMAGSRSCWNPGAVCTCLRIFGAWLCSCRTPVSWCVSIGLAWVGLSLASCFTSPRSGFILPHWCIIEANIFPRFSSTPAHAYSYIRQGTSQMWGYRSIQKILWVASIAFLVFPAEDPGYQIILCLQLDRTQT